MRRSILLTSAAVVLVSMALAWKVFVVLGWRATHPNRITYPFSASFAFPWMVVSQSENGVKVERFTHLFPTFRTSYSEVVLQNEPPKLAAQPDDLWLAERSAMFRQKALARRYRNGSILCAEWQMGRSQADYCRSRGGTATYAGTGADFMNAIDVLADLSSEETVVR